MRVLRSVALVIVALALMAHTAFAQATVYHGNISVPFSMWVYIPCAGEVAMLDGNLHILTHLTFDNAGGLTFKAHFQPQGLSGTGSVTGDKYQGTGVTQWTSRFSGTSSQYEFTYINNFRMIGQGTGNNFLVHANMHFTVNANGDVTASVGNASASCK